MEEFNGFESFKLNPQLLSAIQALKYEVPTPIQQKAIPQIHAGHDVIGIAQTGTGKTAAFVLPILMKIKYAQGLEPRVLILAPTRELVIQIEDNIRDLSIHTDLRHVALYGGLGPKKQIEQLEAGVDIIIATPGRFLDLYRMEHVHVKKINTMVMDEADKMMDMGFMPQIRNILEVIPRKRQNLLFSATMPEKVVELSHEFLEFPIKVEASVQATPAETVDQFLYQTPNFLTKINLLEFLLQGAEVEKGIIFTKTKASADNVYKFIHRKITNEVRVIHANKGQNSRLNAIQLFRDNEIKLLVSTDVTARGIDISDVSHVINFEIPGVYEDYVHRIGRTGRAMRSGVAISMANEAEMHHIRKIEKIIRQSITVNPLPEEVNIEKTGFEEQQKIARELDHLKRKDDPNFKGAFHEKKEKSKKPAKNQSYSKRRKKRK